MNNEVAQIARDLIETQKELAIHQLAHTQILCALLNVIDHNALQRLKKILEFQSSSGELQGRAAESCRLAVEIVSLATKEDWPPDLKTVLRLIQGGKNND